MKTILIPIFDGTIGRNLLRTGALSALKLGGCRIVLIPPKDKIAYYQSEFADGKQVFIETSRFWAFTRLEFFFDSLFRNSIPTKFMKIRQVDWYWHKKRYLYYVIASILRCLGHFRWWRKFLCWLELMRPIPQYVKEIFDRWQPDVVFAPTMIPRDEVALMKLARRSGKISIGMVKTWDNLTSKAFIRFFPDWLIVHNEIIADEANKIYDYPLDRIFISGIPQFDDYLKPGFIEPAEQFFKKIGADPSKKLILYAPAGDWMSLYDKEIVEMLLGWIDDGLLGDAQVLLRLHPAYESRTEELSGRKNLIIERPAKHFGGPLKDFEFDIEDMRHLASSIFHSAITINTASTMAIEAAIFDRPIILIGFDGVRKLGYWGSVIRYYDREHCVPLVRSDGARLVRSGEEFLNALKDYLASPGLNREGRACIVKEQCWQMDGCSGERIGNFIISKLT